MELSKAKKNSRLIYHNVNPKKLEINDCVCRAISFASGIPYEVVDEKLFYTSKLMDCDKLCINCYSFLLDNYFKFEKLRIKGTSINEFAEKNNKGLFIVRVKQHLSVVNDGYIYDIWDCGEEIITDLWKVN